MRRALFVSLYLVVAAGTAWAQPPVRAAGTFEAFGLAGPGYMWDDEGYLGTAVVGGVGFGYRLGHLRVEGVFDRRHHHPDFDSGVVFRADASRVTGRLLYFFGQHRVQPYAGGAVGVMHVDRFSSFPDDCRFVDRQFICAGTREFESSDRSRVLSAIAGVRFQSGRWFVRPEFEMGRSGNDLTIAGSVAVGMGW